MAAPATNEDDEVAALDRVLTRVAMADDAQLGAILDRLLPMAVDRLRTPSAKVRAKLLEMLSHVNRRVKPSASILLPLESLLALALGGGGGAGGAPPPPPQQQNQPQHPMVRSFALVYSDMAFARASSARRARCAGALLAALSDGAPGGAPPLTGQPRQIVERMALAAIAELPSPLTATGVVFRLPAEDGSATTTTTNLLPVAEVLPTPAAGDALCVLALRLLLYPGRATPGASTGIGGEGGNAARLTPLGLAQQHAAATAAAAAAPPAPALPPPPGLSQDDVSFFEPAGSASAADAAAGAAAATATPDALQRAKLGMLNLLGAALAAGTGADSAGGSGAAVAAAVAAGRPPSGGGGTRPASAAGADDPLSPHDGQQDPRPPPPPAPLTPPQALLPLLVAASDPRDAVSRRGDELLRKWCAHDGARPPVDLDDRGVAAKLLRLLLGTRDAAARAALLAEEEEAGKQGGNNATTAAPTTTPDSTTNADDARVASLPESAQTSPASPALACRLAALLVRSTAAARCFPANAAAVACLLYGDASASARARALGMELAVWTFKHAPEWQLRAMAPAVMGRLMSGLGLEEEEEEGGDKAAAAAEPMDVDGAAATHTHAPPSSGSLADPLARGFAYEAVAALARRLPGYYSSSPPRLARAFFAALASEPAAQRASVLEALSALAGAYVAAEARELRARAEQEEVTAQAAATAKAAASGNGNGNGAAAKKPRPSDPDDHHDKQQKQHLEPLLLEAAQSPVDAVRLAAARWSARLFPPCHLASRYTLLLAAGDAKAEVREAGLRGLGLAEVGGGGLGGAVAAWGADEEDEDEGAGGALGEWTAGVASAAATAAGGGGGNKRSAPLARLLARLSRPPSPGDLIAYVTKRHPRLAQPADEIGAGSGPPLPVPARAFRALVAVLGRCRADRGDYGGEDGSPSSSLPAHALLLEHALAAHDAPRELVADALEALVALAAEPAGPFFAAADANSRAPTSAAAVADRYRGPCFAALAARYARSGGRSTRLLLRPLLAHADASARAAAARLLGIAAAALPPREAAALLSDSLLPALSVVEGSKPASPDEREGCALAAGFVAAELCRRLQQQQQQQQQRQGEGEEATAMREAVAAAASALTALVAAAAAHAPPAASAAPAAATSSSASLPPAPAPALAGAAALSLGHLALRGGLGEAAPPLVPQLTAMVRAGGTDARGGRGHSAGGGGGSEGGAHASATTIGTTTTSDRVRAALRAVAAVGMVAAGAGGEAAAAAGVREVAAAELLGLLAPPPPPPPPQAAAGTAPPPPPPRPRAPPPLREEVVVAVGEALALAFAPKEALGAVGGADALLRAGGGGGAAGMSLAAAMDVAEAEERRALKRAGLWADEEEEEGGEEAMAVDGAATADHDQQQLQQHRLIDQLLRLALNDRPEARAAAAVWLVSLLSYACRGDGALAATTTTAAPPHRRRRRPALAPLHAGGGTSPLRPPPAVAARLQDLQLAFTALLADSGSELTQEVASRGVALCYRCGGPGARRQLVAQLVADLGAGGAAGQQTQPHQSSAARLRAAAKLTDDTKIFEPGQLGQAPAAGGGGEGGGGSGEGGGLSTYREICSLATDLGQPDLVYRFLDLANHAAAVGSRRGAAAGFAGVARLAGGGGGGSKKGGRRGQGGGGLLTPAQRRALLPRLYRHRHDPSARVAEAMRAIWDALAEGGGGGEGEDDEDEEGGDPVTALLPEIGRSLVASAGARTWRERQSALLALAELVASCRTGSGKRGKGGGTAPRSWRGELELVLPSAWRSALRGADDVKESVRAAGLILCRALRTTTLRLVDPTGGQGDGGEEFRGFGGGGGHGGGGTALTVAGLPPSSSSSWSRAKATSTTPAARQRARDAQAAAAATLPLLLEIGLPSPVAEVRAVSLDVLAEATKAAGGWRPLAGPVLPQLTTALLEALSGLEDARLSYAEQHAARLGMEERLEGARVAASRASPMAEALDRCAAYAAEAAGVAAAAAQEQQEKKQQEQQQEEDAALARAVVAGVVAAVAAQLRRGVGLNTKVGAARFARSLASRGGSGLLQLTPPPAVAGAGSEAGAAAGTAQQPPQPTHAAALVRPLVSGTHRERSLAVRRAYAAAAASIAASSGSAVRCDALVSDALGLYGGAWGGGGGGGGGQDVASSATATTTSASQEERLAGGMLLRELLRASPDLFASRAAARALPLAFAARLDDDSEVAAAWGGVWSEGAPSEGAAVRLYAPQLARLLRGGLCDSPRWGDKRAAALALAAMARLGAGGEALRRDGGELGGGLLAPALLAVLSSSARLWDGKEALLEACGALGAALFEEAAMGGGAQEQQQQQRYEQQQQLLAALVAAMARRKQGYRAAALAAAEELLLGAGRRAGGGESGSTGRPWPGAWPLVAPPLLEALAQHGKEDEDKQEGKGGAAEAAAAAAEAEPPPKPLPMPATLTALKAAWAVASPEERLAGGDEAAARLGAILTLPGAGWQAWAAAADAGRAMLLLQGAGGTGPPPCASWLAPLARGAAFVAVTTNVAAAREAALRLARAVADGVAAAGGAKEDSSSLAAACAQLRAALAQIAAGSQNNASIPLGDRTAAAEALERLPTT